MVIINSDSNSTLVSLGNGLKRCSSLELLQQASYRQSSADGLEEDEPIQFAATHLWLPEDEDEDYWCERSSEGDDCSFHSCSSQVLPRQEPVYLPKRHQQSSEPRLGVDECLSFLPSVTEAVEDLASAPVTAYGSQTQQTILYVGQGEVGHAVPLQTNVILSDRATTCHILMLYSSSEDSVPLASCAHLDSTDYEECIRDMFARHQQHHNGCTTNKTDLDVHICGGFDDADGTSKQISNWLLYLLADIAEEYASTMHCTLKTAAISAMNTTCEGSVKGPLCRGLALNLRTGKVWRASVPDTSVAGPDYILRQSRLWCHDGTSAKALAVVHEEKQSTFQVSPFQLRRFSEIDVFLQLPDDVLLKYISTSPDCEEADFCDSVRSTLRFLKCNTTETTFPRRLSRGYKRIPFSNQWRLV